jgi:transketolase
MVWKSIEAAKVLTEKGVSVELINMHTIKPLDVSAVLSSVSKTGCVVTAEEHMANGGLGEAVAQVLSKNHPCPHEFVAVDDSFGESGKPMDLLDKYGLGTSNIVEAVEKAIERKS